MKEEALVELVDVLAASDRIASDIHETPLLRSQTLDSALGCQVALKAEPLQKTGSFKARGALNFFATREEAPQSVTTYSSGNHGQAVAWLAQLRGIKARIFVPESIGEAKRAGMAAYGAEIIQAGDTVDSRKQACLDDAMASGALVIPPFDHPAIIAGQGTTMIEILRQHAMFDVALMPAGGGGLLSGSSVVLKGLRPRVEVFAAEPLAANDMQLSLESGSRQTIPRPDTIADGVRHVQPGDLTWPLIQRHVDGGLTCDEDDIRHGMVLMHRHLKLVSEPTGAVALGCLWAHRNRFKGRSVVVIVTGGNISAHDYARLLGRG